MTDHDKNMALQVLNVHCSIKSKKYLGLPNMMGQIRKIAFQGLKDRLKQKINNWSVKTYLSRWQGSIYKSHFTSNCNLFDVLFSFAKNFVLKWKI